MDIQSDNTEKEIYEERKDKSDNDREEVLEEFSKHFNQLEVSSTPIQKEEKLKTPPPSPAEYTSEICADTPIDNSFLGE